MKSAAISYLLLTITSVKLDSHQAKRTLERHFKIANKGPALHKTVDVCRENFSNKSDHLCKEKMLSPTSTVLHFGYLGYRWWWWQLMRNSPNYFWPFPVHYVFAVIRSATFNSGQMSQMARQALRCQQICVPSVSLAWNTDTAHQSSRDAAKETCRAVLFVLFVFLPL